MKKQLYKSGIVVGVFIISSVFAGCSDQFLKDKQNYDAYSSDIYNDYTGCLERINALYYYLQPQSTEQMGYDMPSAGTADICSRSTLEYGGLISSSSEQNFVDPTTIFDNTSVPDFIYRENKNVSPYGRIRECNNIIEGISGGTLSDDVKKPLLGQAYFFRAWCYYRLVKIYGGVPIIDHVQNAMVGEGEGADLIVPRSTTKECIDFICKDLDLAATYLPVNWKSTEATNYGRITAGTALALKGRARLLYASPLFNRTDDASRWSLAYEANKAALAKLTEGGFGLAYASAPGSNASGWAKQFSDYTSSEAVFVTLYNTVKKSTGTNYDRNNGWESSIRPYNAGGGGGKSTTSQMIDLFPMTDGLPSSYAKSNGLASSLLTTSGSAYYPQLFFANRDPRFYRTFAFPGERWTFSGDPTSLGLTTYPYVGSKYELWSYCWYATTTERDAEDKSGFAADGLGTYNKSVMVRKRTDDYDVNTAPLYVYDITNKFSLSAAPFMEMRYAEVLLNFAEAACGAGYYSEAVSALQQIRARVGYTAATNYGLGSITTATTDRATIFAAILYERQIELAYEGKRFDDMRRWMLWDGGVGQSALKSSWALTGFNGNTCTYLGLTPMNGTRRNGIEIRVADSKGVASTAVGNDPIRTVKRPMGFNLATSATTRNMTSTTYTTQMDSLCLFYSNNFYRKATRVDGAINYVITFLPKYYFIGFKTNMQSMNVTLKQTIGWADLENGGADGTFDPLAE